MSCGTAARAAQICRSVRSTRASPCSGTPSAVATARIRSSTPSSVRASSKYTTGMPELSSWPRTSSVRIVASVRITEGSSPRIASTSSAWPAPVTTGTSAASGKPVGRSRPTTFAPNPRL
ncbi:Uncharacterised protein [Mycobacteroides abscessus]|nr:Uncharacterised protein [Mycobacteroides abscessus]